MEINGDRDDLEREFRPGNDARDASDTEEYAGVTATDGPPGFTDADDDQLLWHNPFDDIPELELEQGQAERYATDLETFAADGERVEYAGSIRSDGDDAPGPSGRIRLVPSWAIAEEGLDFEAIGVSTEEPYRDRLLTVGFTATRTTVSISDPGQIPDATEVEKQPVEATESHTAVFYYQQTQDGPTRRAIAASTVAVPENNHDLGDERLYRGTVHEPIALYSLKRWQRSCEPFAVPCRATLGLLVSTLVY